MKRPFLRILFPILQLALCLWPHRRAFPQTDSLSAGKSFKEWLLNPAYPDSLKAQKARELLLILRQRLEAGHPQPAEGFSQVSLLVPPDKSWRLLTFTVLFADGHYQNFGLLQNLSSKTRRPATFQPVFELQDQTAQLGRPLHKTLDASHWMGAIYYAVRKSGKKHWLLLGLNMHNAHSRLKIAEPLSFNSRGFPQFGAPIIRHQHKTYHRFILEYKADAAVHLRWDDQLNMIVYDHLTPYAPSGRSQPAAYVPDGSYNGLRWHKKHWEVVEDVDARNPPTPSRPVPPPPKGLLPPEK
ncbi:MAG: hypothetical protein N2050_05625 [Flavobacteriales bacterium]|nr:hypothetical protein [Flavobacteriales bacterium]MCX7650015.1 hypothetical protein [Flavobacteriales bacterium]MDW8432004.1 hypothetical protein [Flavobacteriales bacterium]